MWILHHINKKTARCFLFTLLLVALPFHLTNAQDTTNCFLAGIKLNNARPYGMLGYVQRISPRYQLYTMVDLGGNNAALGELLHARVFSSGPITLLIDVGPNLEFITADPNFTDHQSFLSAASGVTIVYALNDLSQLHLGILFLTPAHPPLPFKLFLGISLPFSSDP